jgi:hypothetical protein
LWDSNRSNSGSRRVGSSNGVAIVLLSVVAPVFPEIARSSSSLLFPGPEFLEPGPELLESEPEFSDVANATISKVFGTQDNERIISAVDGSHNNYFTSRKPSPRSDLYCSTPVFGTLSETAWPSNPSTISFGIL